MKKVQIFSAPSIKSLQSEVNDWLDLNKDVHVIETNMTALAKARTGTLADKIENEFAFYILYTPADQGEEESVLQASMQMPFELTDPKIIDMESN